jgi:hypothetical protein
MPATETTLPLGLAGQFLRETGSAPSVRFLAGPQPTSNLAFGTLSVLYGRCVALAGRWPVYSKYNLSDPRWYSVTCGERNNVVPVDIAMLDSHPFIPHFCSGYGRIRNKFMS